MRTALCNRKHVLYLAWLTTATWLATVITVLTMMWDATWMSSDPPAEVLTGALHSASVVAGLGLGVMLLFPQVWQRLRVSARCACTIAGLCGCLSVYLWL